MPQGKVEHIQNRSVDDNPALSVQHLGDFGDGGGGWGGDRAGDKDGGWDYGVLGGGGVEVEAVKGTGSNSASLHQR